MFDPLPILISWLDPKTWGSAFIYDPIRSSTIWSELRRAIVRQGVGAYLAAHLTGTPLYRSLPESFRDWLHAENVRSSQRADGMRDDLECILAMCSRAGVAVMPLKGGLLAHHIYPNLHWRPMADLDLLIHPGDLQNVTSLLLERGYSPLPPSSRYDGHTAFAHPQYRTVEAMDGEHPLNPRPVEVHTMISRPFWGDLDPIDLTCLLWENSKPAELLGWPIHKPTHQALIAHLSLHALQDILIHKTRLIQWLDLAWVAQKVDQAGELPHPDKMYPALRLASRAFPKSFVHFDLDYLAMRTPPGVRRHFDAVPLDRRAGLAGPTPLSQRGTLRLHWDRWALHPWRLELVYGNIPYPAALARHTVIALRHLLSR